MDQTQTYILKHKDIDVMKVKVEDWKITEILELYSKAHSPIEISEQNPNGACVAIDFWLSVRATPQQKDNVISLLSSLGVESTELVSQKAMGLSLSDCYWICPEGIDVKWKDANFFENDFTENLTGEDITKKINIQTFENTPDGKSQKRWRILNGKRYIIKEGKGEFQQEPYNEEFASELLKCLGLPCAKYKSFEYEGNSYSMCKCFASPKSEFITAGTVLVNLPRDREKYVLLQQRYIDNCKELGIPKEQTSEFLDKMMVFDYLIRNTDRHVDNFGIMRDPDTLKIIGHAPIFDNERSLWHKTEMSNIKNNNTNSISEDCKLFKKTHEEQLGLVRSFNWLDMSKLKDIEQKFMEITKNSNIPKERIETIVSAFQERVQHLQEKITLIKNLDNDRYYDLA